MERTNRIKWYFADDGATIYEGKHVFSPRIDSLDDDPTGLYEFTARRTNQRRYSAGRNDWDAHGTHVDGDAEDFLGQAPRPKHWIDGVAPSNPCGLVQHHGVGVQIGCRERDMLYHRSHGFELGHKRRRYGPFKQGIEIAAKLQWQGKHGIEVECKARDNRSRTPQGFEFGILMRTPGSKPISATEGVELGNVVRVGVPPVTRILEGVELGDVVGVATPKWPSIREGIELGTHVRVITPMKPRDEEGLELGAIVLAGDALHPRVIQGLELGVIVLAGDALHPRVLQGLELGCTIRTIEGEGGGGGATCEEATEMTFVPGLIAGVYEFNLVGGEEKWFKMAVTVGGTFRIVRTIVSGDYSASEVYYGTACSGKTPYFELDIPPVDDSGLRPGMIDGYWFVSIYGNGTYRFTVSDF